MGGDHAPVEILQGCWQAAPLLDPDDTVFLVGDESIIRRGLESSPLNPQQKKSFKVVATTQIIAMDESPVEAVRAKPDSSINIMCKLAAKGEADAVISAGNTGACVAAAQLRMRLLPGVARPGIAIMLPTYYGPVVICDVGANPEPKPKHIEQYAIMASEYAKAVCGRVEPRVGLLSIGEEDAKGNTLTREARKFMRDEPLINFIGNVEGRDLFKGGVDVVVCDGFVGNIVLKFTEGMADGLMRTIVAEITEAAPELVEPFNKIMQKIYAKHDWQEYGGAPLLGVDGYMLICHGRSEARAIKNAIRVIKQLTASRINEKIVQSIEKSIPVMEE
jgi:glycerol-3-phosphate acyltransferase PlsX